MIRVGVNYVPRKNWFYSWLDFDLDAVRKDLAGIAELGLDHVRIFPFWALLQPNPNLILDSQLEQLRKVVQAAADEGLDIWVDVFQGHLSSFDFLPSWVASWHECNIFTDPQAIEAETRLINAVGQALSDIPGVKGLSLGNEIVQFAAKRHPNQQQLTPEEADNWVSRLLAAARNICPEGRHSFSYDDDLFFDETQPFDPRLLEKYGDLATVHSWVFGKVGQRLGVDHPRLALFARYLLEITAAWAPNKPLWLQEVGAPLNYVSKMRTSWFVEETLSQAAASPGLEMITWWCSHDVNRHLLGFPAVEYDLGLWTSDQELKPAGKALRDWIRHPRIAQVADEQNIIEIPAINSHSTTQEVAAGRQAISPGGEIFADWAAALEANRPKKLKAKP